MESFWKDKRVLITGGTGFLGSWLTSALVEQGAEVVGLIRDLVPQSNFYLQGLEEKVIIVWGKIEDYPLLERILNEYEIEFIFHLAAQTQVLTAHRGPLSTFDSNIKGTWNILEATRVSPGLKKILFTSTDKAYGLSKELPYTEDTPLRATFTYDVSKACADLIVTSYHQTFGLPVAITRCGNLFGGGDLNFNRLLPGVIRMVLKGEPPIIRSDGKYIRDYLYVKDAVEALLLLGEKMEGEELWGQAFNFSYELRMPVEDLVKKILALMGREDLKPIILDEARGELREQYLSCQRAREVLDWRPRFSFDEALRETIDWYRKFFKV